MTQPFDLPPERPITLHDLYSVERLDGFKKIEIVEGEWYLTEEAYYSRHDFQLSLIQTKLMVALAHHIRENHLGRIYSGSLGFVLEGHHNAIQLLRRTDIAFVSKNNIPRNNYEPYYCAPDLAVEVVKEHSSEDMNHRVSDFFRHGTEQVWQVYPHDKRIKVCLPNDQTETYDEHETIYASDLLSEFELDVSTIFKT